MDRSLSGAVESDSIDQRVGGSTARRAVVGDVDIDQPSWAGLPAMGGSGGDLMSWFQRSRSHFVMDWGSS